MDMSSIAVDTCMCEVWVFVCVYILMQAHTVPQVPHHMQV